MTAADGDGRRLHELLRDLVDRQGPGVLETADGFRAALDDFLTEDEATTGELNLLVDAVRLGAVTRLLSILDHGGDPAGAIREAGDAMARDRGTDDATRSRWAVAALGFALGRVTEDDVRRHPAETLSPPASPPPAPPPPTPKPPKPEPPRVPPTEAVDRPGPATLGDREPERSTWDHGATPPPVPPPPPPVTRGRRAWPAVAAVVVLLLVAGAALGWMLYNDDEEPGTSTRDGETAEPSVDPSIDLPAELPSNAILISANDGESARIHLVDADTGAVERLTYGPSDNLPNISRDREQVVFLARATKNAVRPMVLDLASGDIHALFGEDGACDYGRRPSFDLAGERMALVCLTGEGEETGVFIVNPDGTLIKQLEVGGSVRGSPTWMSESEIVYSRGEERGGVPSSLWRVNVDTGEERPLTTGADGWDSQPIWSETRGLLFVRSESSVQQGELWTITDRGFEERLPIDEPVSGPVWSPGGSQVAFTVEGEDGPELVTAPSDDPAAYTPVDDIPGKITIPVWGTR